MEKELSKKMDTFVGEGGFRIGCYECEDAIDRSSLKPFIHSYTRSLLEAFAEEVIPWKVNLGDSYRLEGWNECSELARLKAKEIIKSLEK